MPLVRHYRDNALVETIEPQNGDRGFTVDERLFSLDDQLRQDLRLGPDDPEALEEIRQTLGPTDSTNQPEKHKFHWEHRARSVRQENPANRPRFEPWFSETTPLDPEVQPAVNQRSVRKSLPARQAKMLGLWLLATFVAVAGLFIQTRYWLFDELSAIPSARTPLESFCRLAGCNVPAPLVGPTFRVLQTRIDLDPQLPGAVIVKIRLTNRTTTPRPYPSVQLTLTNPEGETIGKRTYSAEDYATTADANELQAGAVAVVSLHLAGPDQNAVGFEASIVNTGT
jgi:hypothetical protein